MSNDAYKECGLYSHQGLSSPSQQPKVLDTGWKKRKNPSIECPGSGDHSNLHRKAMFSRTNSNSSSGSYGNAKFSDISESSGDSFKSALSHPPELSGYSSNTFGQYGRATGTVECSDDQWQGTSTKNLTRTAYLHGSGVGSDSTNILDDTAIMLLTGVDSVSPLEKCSELNSDASSPSEFVVENAVFRAEPVVPQTTPASPTPTATTTTTTANMLPDASNLECGLLGFRPQIFQRLASIKVFVLFLSLLVTVQQAVASGYLNSVITTLEKRYEVPSYITGLISSMYEIGNVSTVIFVSYLGSSRNIPVWIAVGCVVMGTGSLLFVGPQLMLERWSVEGAGINSTNSSSICTAATVHHQPIDKLPELGFPKLQGPPSSPSNCPPDEASPAQLAPVLFFMVGQLLLGAGGSPLLTLGTTYIDDHVAKKNSSLYIGIIYTMSAFGPVLGFLLGGYLLSYYVDTYFVPDELIHIDRTHPRWIGMWWAGFLYCSIALIVLSVPFLMFPKRLSKEREKVRLAEKKLHENITKGHRRNKSETSTCSKQSRTSLASRRMYGKDVRDIPACLFKLLLNPIYFMTSLAACMELIIVSGFIVFLPKYLETQFSISNVQASVFTGGVAIPGACIGTFLGGYILKRFSLRPKGALQLVMVCNLIGLSLYGLVFVLGCENVKMAGTTSPYFIRTADGKLSSSVEQMTATPILPTDPSSLLTALGGAALPKFMSGSATTEEPQFLHVMDSVARGSTLYSGGKLGSSDQRFRVNLTSWCNTGCECSHRLAEPVCGNNGLTYFSPCHAGCTAVSPSSFTNCTCE